MNDRKLSRGPLLLLASLVVVIDQVSKHLVASVLADGRTIPLVPGLLEGRLVHNTGAAFSLFRDSVHWLGGLSLAVTAGLLIWLSRQRSLPVWQGMAVAFLLGGTLGNGHRTHRFRCSGNKKTAHRGKEVTGARQGYKRSELAGL